MKKHNCRRTPEEQAIHKTAVKIVKMPENTLVSMYAAAIKAGFSEGSTQRIHIPSGPTAEDFMKRIEDAAKIRTGIVRATLSRATVTKLRAIYDGLTDGDEE